MSRIYSCRSRANPNLVPRKKDPSVSKEQLGNVMETLFHDLTAIAPKLTNCNKIDISFTETALRTLTHTICTIWRASKINVRFTSHVHTSCCTQPCAFGCESVTQVRTSTSFTSVLKYKSLGQHSTSFPEKRRLRSNRSSSCVALSV